MSWFEKKIIKSLNRELQQPWETKDQYVFRKFGDSLNIFLYTWDFMLGICCLFYLPYIIIKEKIKK